jgi:ankyrin repeat protein
MTDIAVKKSMTDELIEAVNKNDVEAVEGLFKRGANVNVEDSYGRAVLEVAAAAGYAEIVRLLIGNGADVNKARFGQTPLMFAANEGHADVARLLIDGGAKVDEVSYGGWTALMYAANHRKTAEVIRLLLESGADANVCSDSGSTALSIAENLNQPEIVQLLKEAGERKSLLPAVQKAEDESDTGERFNAELSVAVSTNSVQRLQELLNPVIDLKAFLGNGAERELLERAVVNGYTEIARLLIFHGAGVNEGNFYGWTPLMRAAALNDVETAAMLIESGADMNLQNMGGWTALMFSIGAHGQDVFRLLLDKGADVCIRNREGETAQDNAKKRDMLEIVELLKTAQVVQECRALASEKRQRLKARAPKVTIRGLRS